MEVDDPAFLTLFSQTVSRIPPEVPHLRTVSAVRLRRKGSLTGVVGLVWCGVRLGRQSSGVHQTITFYTDLLYGLSDDAKVAVIAHELAHAWLNEHERPEQSKRREKQADDLAREWGFGEELAQLDKETEPVQA